MWRWTYNDTTRARGGARLVATALVTVLATGLLVAAPAAGAREVERVPQASGTAAAAVTHARGQIGTPYRYGASGPDAFDCSGLVQWSYRQAGVSLPRTTGDQARRGSAVSWSALRPGDLVFFYPGQTHVGIYTGNGRMVHAPRSGRTVEEVRLSGHYADSFVAARRVA